MKNLDITNLKLWIRDFSIALIIGLVVIQFVRPTIVSGHSMEPTLNDHDYLFLNRQAYLLEEPDYGDIVVFQSSITTFNGDEKLLIKRIIGLPGDIIHIADGVVYRNGQALEEPYTLEAYTYRDMDEKLIPVGSLFVVGDNRQGSRDSRDPSVGCVPMEAVVGKAIFRLYPFNQIGFVK